MVQEIHVDAVDIGGIGGAIRRVPVYAVGLHEIRILPYASKLELG